MKSELAALGALALLASALRSMRPESSLSFAVEAFDEVAAAVEAEVPTLAVSALSEKSIEFSSRCPACGGGAARPNPPDAWALPLYSGALVATSSTDCC